MINVSNPKGPRYVAHIFSCLSHPYSAKCTIVGRFVLIGCKIIYGAQFQQVLAHCFSIFLWNTTSKVNMSCLFLIPLSSLEHLKENVVLHAVPFNISRGRAPWSLWYRTLCWWEANLKWRVWKAAICCVEVFHTDINSACTPEIRAALPGANGCYELEAVTGVIVHSLVHEVVSLWLYFTKWSLWELNKIHGWGLLGCSGRVVELMYHLSPGCCYWTARRHYMSIQCHPLGCKWNSSAYKFVSVCVISSLDV